MGTVKDSIAEQLGKRGTLSSSDVGRFARPAEGAAPPAGAAAEKPSVVEIPEVARKEPVANNAKSTSSEAVSAALGDKPRNAIQAIFDDGFADMQEIEITPAEKAAFVESLVSGKRMRLPFAIFGGQIRGAVQNRTNDESRSIMTELHRQLVAKEFTDPPEYASRLRLYALRFQLVELNGVSYKTPEGLLLATMGEVTDTDGAKKAVVIPPAWVSEARTMFGPLADGMTTALQLELRRFEYKYWSMVANAQNQSFWTPEGSI